MPKLADRDRILNLLGETNGLSSARIRYDLNLTDERYATVRNQLITEGLAEKYACQGGGLRLTRKGEREFSPDYEVASTVSKEADLYAPLVQALLHDAPETLAFDSSALRRRGKWQNPDVTQISVDVYPRIRHRRVIVTTYEVKQWMRWSVDAVFEAASHARFGHESVVVLEWPDKVFSIEDPRIEGVVRECRRFEVGLATLEPYYSHYRLQIRLEPQYREPTMRDLDEWLDYVLSRNSVAEERFNEIMTQAEPQFRPK